LHVCCDKRRDCRERERVRTNCRKNEPSAYE
jgi:hypothetical protein